MQMSTAVLPVGHCGEQAAADTSAENTTINRKNDMNPSDRVEPRCLVPHLHTRKPIRRGAVLPNQAAAHSAEVDAANRPAVVVIHTPVPADAALAHAARFLRAVGVDLAGAEA